MVLCVLASIFFRLSPFGRSRREGRADVTTELEIWHPPGKREEWEMVWVQLGPGEGQQRKGDSHGNVSDEGATETTDGPALAPASAAAAQVTLNKYL